MRKLILSLIIFLGAAACWAAQEETPGALQQIIQRGNDFLNDDKFDQAVQQFRQAVRTYPDNSEAHQRLAQAYSLIGRLDDALMEDKRSIELDPKNADAHSNMAWLLGKQKHFGQAAREARIALQLDPDNSSSYMTLGLALASLDDYEGAIAADQRALQLEPTNPKAYINLAATLGRSGDYTASIEAYRMALELQPGSVAAHLGLGAALGKSGLLDEQIREFQLACQLAPGSDNAHGKLGWAYYKKGNLEGALKEGWITNWIRLQKSGPEYFQKVVATWGAVFLLFGLIFAVIFSGSKFKPEEGEHLVKSYFLIFYKDKPGRFVITDRRLLFVPEAFSGWFGSQMVSIQRDQVCKIDTAAQGRSKVLIVELPDGTSLRFSVPQLVLKPLLSDLSTSSEAAPPTDLPEQEKELT